MSTSAYGNLVSLCKDISNLSAISGILSWDEQVMMPPGSASSRGQQKAALASVIHARSTSQELEHAISAAKKLQGLGEYEVANVRDAERNFRRAVGVPPELERKIAVHEVACVQMWVEARKQDDYPSFESSLREMVSLTKEKAAAMSEGDVYDTMVDTFERGMTAERLSQIFRQIEKPLGELLEEVLRAKKECKRDIHPALKGGDKWDVAQQAELSSEICKILGFNTDKGRIGKLALTLRCLLICIPLRISGPKMFTDLVVTVTFSCCVLYWQMCRCIRLLVVPALGMCVSRPATAKRNRLKVLWVLFMKLDMLCTSRDEMKSMTVCL